MQATRLGIDLLGDGQVSRELQALLRQAGIPLASIRTRSQVRRLAAEGGITVDATAPAYEGPAAWTHVRFLQESLLSGQHLVTCNKAPLAIAWDALAQAARGAGTALACSATVGAGTPVLATLRHVQRVRGLDRIEASLSGTLAFVLSRVAQGSSLQAALQEAQREGYAEPDPTLDLDGTDALAKATILHNALFTGQPPLVLTPDRPRLWLEERSLRALCKVGAPRVVAVIEPGAARLELRAEQASGSTGPPSTGIEVSAFHPDGQRTRLVGPGAGPHATAQALLADIQAVLAGARGVLP